VQGLFVVLNAFLSLLLSHVGQTNLVFEICVDAFSFRSNANEKFLWLVIKSHVTFFVASFAFSLTDTSVAFVRLFMASVFYVRFRVHVSRCILLC